MGRKLLIVPEHEPTTLIASSPHSGSTIHRTNNNNNNQDYYVSGSYGGGFGSYRLNPPLDASMALTILVLLIALFFMAFFSLYIRRFSHHPAAHRRGLSSSLKGSDPDTVGSLPVFIYNGEEIECTICLSEFEQGQAVKTIPYCGHVFHLECIDTWLGCHVTCPLCRTARLFPTKDQALIRCHADGGGTVGGLGSTVDGTNTYECVGPRGLRRSSSSCFVSGERVVWLRRSLSF